MKFAPPKSDALQLQGLVGCGQTDHGPPFVLNLTVLTPTLSDETPEGVMATVLTIAPSAGDVILTWGLIVSASAIYE